MFLSGSVGILFQKHIEVQDVRNDGSTPLIVALEGAPAKVKNEIWRKKMFRFMQGGLVNNAWLICHVILYFCYMY